MSQDLYRPTLDTVEDVRAWMRSWTPLGGFPHPDDSAWLTCEDEVALGFGEAHAKYPSHDEGGHLSIVGPAAPTTKEDALAYDASLTRAHELVHAAGLDIYALLTDIRDEHEDDALEPERPIEHPACLICGVWIGDIEGDDLESSRCADDPVEPIEED